MITALCWIPRAQVKTRPVLFKESLNEEASDEQSPGNEETSDQANLFSSEEALIDSFKDNLRALGKQKDIIDDQEEKMEDDEHTGENDDVDDDDIDIEGAELDEENLNEEDDDDLEVVDDVADGNELEAGIDEDDIEDVVYKKSDAIIVVATTDLENECGQLEVQVYDDSEGAIYTHHDIPLPTFPLSLARLPEIRGTTNSVAVGSFNPVIELWELDIINVSEPLGQLGTDREEDLSDPSLRSATHLDAVLSLDCCHETKTLLSGSADMSIKTWDLENLRMICSFEDSKDKIKVVKYSPTESNIFLSLGFDKQLSIYDTRNSSARVLSSIVSQEADAECAVWCRGNPFLIACGMSNGYVMLKDLRKSLSTSLTFSAHKDQPCNVIDFSSHPKMGNIFATASEEKVVRLWDLNALDQGRTKKNMGYVAEQPMEIGKIFTLQFSLDNSTMLAAGGDTGTLGMWDFGQEVKIQGLLK